MLKFLLDTNIVIYTLKNRPEQVRQRFNRFQGQMAISSITWGELVFGAERSAAPERNLRDIEDMAARLEVLSFDQHASTHFGQIRAALLKQGTPIGPYDMMIAGHARSLGLVLVTNNQKEFVRVPGIQLENWAS